MLKSLTIALGLSIISFSGFALDNSCDGQDEILNATVVDKEQSIALCSVHGALRFVWERDNKPPFSFDVNPDDKNRVTFDNWNGAGVAMKYAGKEYNIFLSIRDVPRFTVSKGSNYSVDDELDLDSESEERMYDYVSFHTK